MTYILILVIILTSVSESSIRSLSRVPNCNDTNCWSDSVIAFSSELFNGQILKFYEQNSTNTWSTEIWLDNLQYICSFKEVYKAFNANLKKLREFRCWPLMNCQEALNCENPTLCYKNNIMSDTCLGGIQARICYSVTLMEIMESFQYVVMDFDDDSCNLLGDILVYHNDDLVLSSQINSINSRWGNIRGIVSGKFDFVPNGKEIICKLPRNNNTYDILNSKCYFTERSRLCKNNPSLECKLPIYKDLKTDEYLYKININSLFSIVYTHALEGRFDTNDGNHDISSLLIDNFKIDNYFPNFVLNLDSWNITYSKSVYGSSELNFVTNNSFSYEFAYSPIPVITKCACISDKEGKTNCQTDSKKIEGILYFGMLEGIKVALETSIIIPFNSRNPLVLKVIKSDFNNVEIFCSNIINDVIIADTNESGNNPNSVTTTSLPVASQGLENWIIYLIIVGSSVIIITVAIIIIYFCIKSNVLTQVLTNPSTKVPLPKKKITTSTTKKRSITKKPSDDPRIKDTTEDREKTPDPSYQEFDE